MKGVVVLVLDDMTFEALSALPEKIEAATDNVVKKVWLAIDEDAEKVMAVFD